MWKLIEIVSTLKSVETLCSKDERLNKLIQLIGDLKIEVRDNYFESLIMSIIGQQLSSKAASTIRERMVLLCNRAISPDKILSLTEDELRGAGLSRAKIGYIKELAEKVRSQQLILTDFNNLENSEVITLLTGVKGIGRWTAEMFLIFSLARTDVMSYADAGLQRAARWLYDLPLLPKYNYLEQLDPLWYPYQSIASLYLWESIDRGFVDSNNTLDELFNSKNSLGQLN